MKREVRAKIQDAKSLNPWRPRRTTGVPAKWNHVGAAFPEECEVCHIVGPTHYPFRHHGIFCAEHCPECAEKRLAELADKGDA